MTDKYKSITDGMRALAKEELVFEGPREEVTLVPFEITEMREDTGEVQALLGAAAIVFGSDDPDAFKREFVRNRIAEFDGLPYKIYPLAFARKGFAALLFVDVCHDDSEEDRSLWISQLHPDPYEFTKTMEIVPLRLTEADELIATVIAENHAKSVDATFNEIMKEASENT